MGLNSVMVNLIKYGSEDSGMGSHEGFIRLGNCKARHWLERNWFH